MQSVGTRLRDARVKKGYTLEEINARTRISLKNLNAIEADELSKISSPFTYRSFVKQISDVVGLDYDTLAPDVQSASSSMPEPLVPGQEDETVVRPYNFQPRPKPTINKRAYATAAAGILAVLVSGYYIWRSFGESGATPSPSATALPASSKVTPPPTPAAVPEPVVQRPLAPVAQQQHAEPAPVAPGTEQLLPPQAATLETVSDAEKRGPIHLELSAIEPTWLSIVADGRERYNGVLQVTEKKILNGWDKARIRTANAGGVTVVFNGRSLGLLGRRGQSRTIVFTKAGYEVVQGVGDMESARVNRNGG